MNRDLLSSKEERSIHGRLDGKKIKTEQWFEQAEMILKT